MPSLDQTHCCMHWIDLKRGQPACKSYCGGYLPSTLDYLQIGVLSNRKVLSLEETLDGIDLDQPLAILTCSSSSVLSSSKFSLNLTSIASIRALDASSCSKRPVISVPPCS